MNDAKKINYGIELLRIICMFMIVMMHLLYKGGILYSESLPSAVVEQAWLVEAFCYVAVNCYVMVSGWLLIHATTVNKKKVLELWLQTILYSIGIGALCFFLFTDVKRMLLVKSGLPVLSNSYWFITSYLVLYLLHPVINRMVRDLEEKQFRRLLIVLVLAFCAWPNMFPFFETLDTTHGYGFIWFVILYLLGAYFKIFWAGKKEKWYITAGYVVLSLCIYLSRILCLKLGKSIDFANYYTYSAYSYNSILVLGASICLFLAFANGIGQMKINKITAAIILFFSKVTLDVYLIHEQVILREYLWTDMLPVQKYADSGWFLLISWGIVLGVFVVCALIGKVRQKVFAIFGGKR